MRFLPGTHCRWIASKLQRELTRAAQPTEIPQDDKTTFAYHRFGKRWRRACLLRDHFMRWSLLACRQQRGIASGGGGVDRNRLLVREPPQIVRAARLGPGAREAGAAEGLRSDDRPDHVAVDINVTVGEASDDVLHRRIDA